MGIVDVKCVKCGELLVQYRTDDDDNITGIGVSRAGFKVKAISSNLDLRSPS